MTNTANYWGPIPNTTKSSYMINDILPAYSANYKLVVSSNATDDILEPNVINVYYNSKLGSISLDYGNSANNNIYMAKNGEDINLTLDTSELNMATNNVSFQWQIYSDCTWNNITNANSTSYTFT